MDKKLPDFQPLPLDSTSDTASSYEKPISRSSYVNPQHDKAPRDDTLSYDPTLRRQWGAEPTLIHATREYEPKGIEISDELRQKHEESVKRYPDMNLSAEEYILAEIYRHPIGLFMPIIGAMVLTIVILSILFLYPLVSHSSGVGDAMPDFSVLLLISIPVLMIVIGFAYVSVWIYQRNRFYLTNESVIQEIQTSLFSRREQTASLGSIEDVSFHQTGLLQTLLDYGSIRLSTEGDETTYRYYYVAEPRRQAATLTNAVEAFKNGRIVDEGCLSNQNER